MSRTWYLLIAAVSVLAIAAVYLATRRAPAPQAAQVWKVPNLLADDMVAPVARAIRAARDAVIRQPGSAESWGHLGAVCDAHEMFDEAQTCYARAHALAPREFSWAYLLAVVADFRGAEHEEVARCFEAARRLSPDYPPLHHRYGDALVRRGKLEAARDRYQRAVDLDDTFGMAHRGLGQVLLSLGDTDGAIAHLEHAADLDPADSIVFTALARAYQLKGNRGRAQEAADRAATLQPQLSLPDPVRFAVNELAVNPKSCVRRFEAGMARGDYDSAVGDLELLVEMFPREPVYHERLGTCYANTGRRSEAFEHLERSLELKEDMVAGHLNLASLLAATGQTDRAIGHYRRAAELAPDNADTHARLGSVLAAGGDLEAALVEFRRAAELSPSDAGLLHNWGTALMHLGALDEAAERLQAAIELNPDSANTLYNLGLVMEQRGRNVEAIRYYRRAVELEPEHMAASRLGKLGAGERD